LYTFEVKNFYKKILFLEMRLNVNNLKCHIKTKNIFGII